MLHRHSIHSKTNTKGHLNYDGLGLVKSGLHANGGPGVPRRRKKRECELRTHAAASSFGASLLFDVRIMS